jgi:hypothetical protein
VLLALACFVAKSDDADHCSVFSNLRSTIGSLPLSAHGPVPLVPFLHPCRYGQNHRFPTTSDLERPQCWRTTFSASPFLVFDSVGPVSNTSERSTS